MIVLLLWPNNSSLVLSNHKTVCQKHSGFFRKSISNEQLSSSSSTTLSSKGAHLQATFIKSNHWTWSMNADIKLTFIAAVIVFGSLLIILIKIHFWKELLSATSTLVLQQTGILMLHNYVANSWSSHIEILISFPAARRWVYSVIYPSSSLSHNCTPAPSPWHHRQKRLSTEKRLWKDCASDVT